MIGAEPAAGGHCPVLLDKVVAVLAPRDGGVYVDGTFGAGGYSRALLGAARCAVWAIDRDPSAIERASLLADEFKGRFTAIAGRFGDMDSLLAARGAGPVDGVALDLGLSSTQLDDPARGFSFMRDGPLDMRMEPSGPSAADVVNTKGERELAALIRTYGEERRAGRVARAIAAARDARAITRTGQLATIVRRAVRRGADRIDPATRTFQALRIYVNDELGELDRGLRAAERLLAAGGRLAVVSFHSLEDRRVKRFLAARSGHAPRPSRHAAPPPEQSAATFCLIARRAIAPAAAEVAANPRARSARMRAAERTAAPAWEEAA